MIAVENATVFRGGGRRWFTRRAAGRAEAKARIKERCECEEGDMDMGGVYPGYTCEYHTEANLPRTAEIVNRLGRFYERRMPTNP